MKRFTALLLISALMFGCFATGCTDSRRSNSDADREETEQTRRRGDGRSSLGDVEGPRHNFNNVDETATFETIHAEAPETPWVLENNIPFSNGNIYEYYNQFLYRSSDHSEIPTQTLNSIATIQRPNVRHYPAEMPGYTVYEVNYIETFPTRIIVPPTASGYSTTWEYHGVGFLDYYTGTTYPVINMASSINSFCVSGNVEYNGETYTVYYYEYRDEDTLYNEMTTDAEGNDIWEFTVTNTETAYFIVPNGYDGIVMYVYSADDTYRTWDEVCADNAPLYTAPHVFGEEGERVEDYTFISIAELG